MDWKHPVGEITSENSGVFCFLWEAFYPSSLHFSLDIPNKRLLVSLFVEFEEAGEDFVAGLKVRRGTKASTARIGSHENKAAVTLLLRNFFGNPRLAAS